MGKVTVVGGKVGMETPLKVDPVFANNDWVTIIKACQKNKVPETWTVGSQKTMTINGVDYPIDIIGKNHDDYSDGTGKAPLTFQMHNLYVYDEGIRMHGSNSNYGGWTSCDMRTLRLPSIFSTMPTEVQSGIKEVNKLTSAGGQSSTINTTADKLFLLSEIEVFGNNPNSFLGEGSQYAYYVAGNSKVKTHTDGGKNYWWLRSPYRGGTTQFCQVNSSGSQVYNKALQVYGVAFAFCF